MGAIFSMSTAFSVTRRSFLVGTLAGLCSGCGNTPLATLPKIVRAAVSGGSKLPLTRAQIEKIPYASIALQIDDANQGLMILRRYDGADLVWATGGQVLVTSRGRIVQTYGFTQDLSATMPYGADPVADFASYRPGYLFKRAVDIEPGHHDGVLVTSEFTRLGPTTIDILGFRHETILWRERGWASLLEWKFTNSYWVDARSGYIWKSLQQPVPDLPPFEVAILRPARHV
jgi:Group 4 capsule polysaccharide lipoprotein gfcB, YjbF